MLPEPDARPCIMLPNGLLPIASTDGAEVEEEEAAAAACIAAAAAACCQADGSAGVPGPPAPTPAPAPPGAAATEGGVGAALLLLRPKAALKACEGSESGSMLAVRVFLLLRVCCVCATWMGTAHAVGSGRVGGARAEEEVREGQRRSYRSLGLSRGRCMVSY